MKNLKETKNGFEIKEDNSYSFFNKKYYKEIEIEEAKKNNLKIILEINQDICIVLR